MSTPKRNPILLIAITALMVVSSYMFVWISGGTSAALTHLFYIPIIFTALACSWQISLATALISGLILAKWFMPLSVEPLLYQDTSTWVFRLSIFAATSLWTSGMVAYINRHHRTYQAQVVELSKLHQATLHALVDLAEMRDPVVTGHHLNRLQHYAKILVTQLSLDEQLSQIIAATISLHDIGKVAIPDSVLNKDGALNEEEWKIVKDHPIHGAHILDMIGEEVTITNPAVEKYMKIAREIILYHHEKYDGSGYPQGTKGEHIPISARIAAVCDVYDSLRSVRPYKESYSHDEAMQIILAGSGTHFDPEIIAAYVAVADEFAMIWDNHGTPVGDARYFANTNCET